MREGAACCAANLLLLISNARRVRHARLQDWPDEAGSGDTYMSINFFSNGRRTWLRIVDRLGDRLQKEECMVAVKIALHYSPFSPSSLTNGVTE